MRICWIGFHQEGLLAFEAVCRQGVRVEACFTLNDKEAAKRSGTADYSRLCARYRVPLYKIRNVNDERVVERLTELGPDILFVIGWSQILHPPALRAAKVGVIGAHASLLPHNRGSAPINWALIKGEQRSGNSLIWLAEDVDGGDIIDQRSFPITPYDTCATLYDHVAESNREMILEVIPALQAGQRPGRVQPESTLGILPRRRPSDGMIAWNQRATRIYDFVRALTRPYPGAFSFLDGEKLTIWRAARLPGTVAAPPGTIVGPSVAPTPENCGQVVSCQGGQLLLLEVEDEAGRVLTGHELCRQPWTNKGFYCGPQEDSGYRRAS